MIPNLDALREALDIESLEPAEQEEMLLQLNEVIFQGTMLRLLDRMDEATKKRFTALLDTEPTEEQLMEFLAQNVPDADAAAAETLEEIQSDILSVTGEGSGTTI